MTDFLIALGGVLVGWLIAYWFNKRKQNSEKNFMAVLDIIHRYHKETHPEDNTDDEESSP